jgi:hypothetical protein
MMTNEDIIKEIEKFKGSPLNKKCDYYTIEKLPNRKQWSLNRYYSNKNCLMPFAYFNNIKNAKLAQKELSK